MQGRQVREQVRSRNQRREAVTALALFLTALVPRLLALNVFVTADERRWVARSVEFFMALLKGNWAGTLQRGHPGVTTMWSGMMGLMAKYLSHALSEGLPVGVGSLLEFLEGVPVDVVDISYLAVMRLPTALLTSIAVVVICLLVKELFGSQVALLSGILLALDPFYLAHSRLLHHDALVTTFMTLSVLSFMVYVGRRRPVGYLVFSGLAAGLAFLSKSTSASLVLFTGLLASAAYLVGSHVSTEVRRRAALRWATRFVVWSLLAGGVFFLLWPAMWVDPGGAINRVVTKAVESGPFRGPALGGNYLLGQSWSGLFYPVTLLYRVTPLVLICSATAVYCLVKGFRLEPSQAIPERLSRTDASRLLGLDGLGKGEKWDWKKNLTWLLAYVLLFTLIVSIGTKKADRYLLPVYPMLDIVAAVGLCLLVERVAGGLRDCFGAQNCPPDVGLSGVMMGRGSSWVLVLVLAFQAGFSLPSYPYYLSCYNPLAGGTRLAPQIVPVGWGEGLDQAARYLNLKENALDLRVASEFGEGFAPFFVGETRPWREKSDADIMPWYTTDYAVLYIGELQTSTPNEATVRYFRSLEPQYTVHLNGIEYAWIYETPEHVPDETVPAQQVRRVQLGDSVLFLGYDLDLSNVADDEIGVNLYWQCLRAMKQSYLVYLKLVNNVYHIWGQVDGIPLGGQLPTNWWQEGIVARDPWKIEILPGTPPGAYHIEVILYDAESQQALQSTGGSQLLLGPLEIPRRGPSPVSSLDIEHLVEASLGDKVRLLGYNIESGFRPGDNIHLILFWQCLEKMQQDYTVFIHWVDEKGNIVAQKDNPPVDGFYPTTKWEPGEIVRDQYDLVISPEVLPGQYQIEIGMYLAETGERLKVWSGSSEADRVLLQKVEIRP
jgi:4-amino-4-deoxy-L-arabinose transferase-like glycosyltransferase